MPNLHILHLEDDLLDADLIHREIAGLGVEPVWTSVTSGIEFADALEHGRFDAIVSDSRIPGIDGLEALEVARRRRPEIPFIFVSGNADPRWAERCIVAGATDCVPKDQLWRLPGALKRLAGACEVERLAGLARAHTTLIDAVKQLSHARSLEAIVEIVTRSARRLTLAQGATVVLREGEHCRCVDEDAIKPLWKGKSLPLSSCISGWAMLHRQAVVVPDIDADARIPHDAYRSTFVKSLLVVPIRAEAPIGAIGNYWAEEHAASADELALLQALADATSLAFENLALYEGLEQRVRQRTLELKEVNSDLEAFSHSVSHDLRAPLRAIQGYGDLLAAEAGAILDSTALKHLEHVRNSARRMNTLIDAMLRLSQVSRSDVQVRPVHVGAIARSILNTLQRTMLQRKVRTIVDTDLMADGDEALLRLALENLLSNAWNFSVHVEDAQIEFITTTEEDGRTVYCVRDNGAGFDMRFAQHLFEPFRRLHRESEFPGTGIGLAIVRRAIHKHGGEIWARSAPGQGASFFFTLEARAG